LTLNPARASAHQCQIQLIGLELLNIDLVRCILKVLYQFYYSSRRFNHPPNVKLEEKKGLPKTQLTQKESDWPLKCSLLDLINLGKGTPTRDLTQGFLLLFHISFGCTHHNSSHHRLVASFLFLFGCRSRGLLLYNSLNLHWLRFNYRRFRLRFGCRRCLRRLSLLLLKVSPALGATTFRCTVTKETTSHLAQSGLRRSVCC